MKCEAVIYSSVRQPAHRHRGPPPPPPPPTCAWQRADVPLRFIAADAGTQRTVRAPGCERLKPGCVPPTTSSTLAASRCAPNPPHKLRRSLCGGRVCWQRGQTAFLSPGYFFFFSSSSMRGATWTFPSWGKDGAALGDERDVTSILTVEFLFFLSFPLSICVRWKPLDSTRPRFPFTPLFSEGLADLS